MRVRALTSFSGRVAMAAGEVREIGDREVLDDLLAAGYVEPAKTGKKGVKANADKPCVERRD